MTIPACAPVSDAAVEPARDDSRKHCGGILPGQPFKVELGKPIEVMPVSGLSHRDHDRYRLGAHASRDEAEDLGRTTQPYVVIVGGGQGGIALGARLRQLGVPTIADRVAQTTVAMFLEPLVEPRFHPDSYGYRPGRSPHDALAVCRQRCWKYDWAIDLDVRKFFDEVPSDLIVKAVEAVTDCRWVLLYVKRWLAAPLQHPDGTLEQREKGTPQGSAISPSPAGRRAARPSPSKW